MTDKTPTDGPLEYETVPRRVMALQYLGEGVEGHDGNAISAFSVGRFSGNYWDVGEWCVFFDEAFRQIQDVEFMSRFRKTPPPAFTLGELKIILRGLNLKIECDGYKNAEWQASKESLNLRLTLGVCEESGELAVVEAAKQ